MNKEQLEAGYRKAEEFTDKEIASIAGGRFTSVIVVAVLILAAVGLFAILG